MKAHLCPAIRAGIFLFLSTATSAALVDNGGGLIYDDVLDITWAQPDTLRRTWDGANTWAAGLTLGAAIACRPVARVAECRLVGFALLAIVAV